MDRKAIAAGYFYPDDRVKLEDFIKSSLSDAEKKDYLVAIVPHAGYLYSGKVAVKTLSRVELNDVAIILGVNHTGFGEAISVFSSGSWQTPLGSLEVDEKLAAEIISLTSAKPDVVAHAREHSIEVILPILKYLKPNLKIVPICVSGMNIAKLKTFAHELSKLVCNKKITIIVSSDMNHYEGEEVTNKKDFLAIDAILNIDADALYEKVTSNDISMCGIYPTIVALTVANICAAKKGELVEHTTSGKVSNDFESVVGYAGILIK